MKKRSFNECLPHILHIPAALSGICTVVHALQFVFMTVQSIQYCTSPPQVISYFDALAGDIPSAPSPFALLHQLIMLGIMAALTAAAVMVSRQETVRGCVNLSFASCIAMAFVHLGQAVTWGLPLLYSGQSLFTMALIQCLTGTIIHAAAAYLIVHRPVNCRMICILMLAQTVACAVIAADGIHSSCSLMDTLIFALSVCYIAYTLADGQK